MARVAFIGTEEFSLAMLEETVRLGAEVVASFSLTREWAAMFPEWRDLGETARAPRHRAPRGRVHPRAGGRWRRLRACSPTRCS